MHRYLLTSLCLFSLITQASGGDWPEFLGPSGMARSVEVVPTTWDETNNMAWKVDLPGTGSSSPIIVGNRVIVTCYVAGDDTAKRQVLCFNKGTGDQNWSLDFPIDYREDNYQGYITEHGYASNTPVALSLIHI